MFPCVEKADNGHGNGRQSDIENDADFSLKIRMMLLWKGCNFKSKS